MKGMGFAGGVAALLLGLLSAPDPCAAAGIVGKVVVVGAVPPPNKLDVTIDQYVCGTEKDSGDLLLSSQKELEERRRLAGEPADRQAPRLPSPTRSKWIRTDACSFRGS